MSVECEVFKELIASSWSVVMVAMVTSFSSIVLSKEP